MIKQPNQWTGGTPRKAKIPPVNVTAAERETLERFAAKKGLRLGQLVRAALIAYGALPKSSADE